MAQHQSQAHTQEPKKTQAPEPKKAQAPAQPAPTQLFQGKHVTKLRDATIGDAFFVEGSDQVVVSLDDGTEQTVRRSELTEAPK